MKLCRRCGETKPHGDFYKCSRKGIQSKCKACQKEMHKLWKASGGAETANRLNREYYARRGSETKAAYSKTDAARVLAREHARAYRAKHPEKALAHRAVSRAMGVGLLERKPCVVCGEPRTHGHHDDYSKPLDVVWLCIKHHAERHRERA